MVIHSRGNYHRGSIQRLRETCASLAVGLGILIVLIVTLFPVVWAVLTSLKLPVDVNAIPPRWFFTPSLVNWRLVFQDWQLFDFLRSSLIVSAFSTLATLILGTPAAYALSRLKIPGKNSIALDILTVRMIPPIVSAIPTFVLARKIGIYDTYLVLVILHATFNLPFTIWLLRGFFDESPAEIEEAGLIDGCSRFQVLRYIALPLAKPGIVCSTIFSFIFSWNEFLFANIMMTGSRRTLPLMISMSVRQRAILWGPASASALIAIVPVLILSTFIQRYLVKGLTFGAVKG